VLVTVEISELSGPHVVLYPYKCLSCHRSLEATLEPAAVLNMQCHIRGRYVKFEDKQSALRERIPFGL